MCLSPVRLKDRTLVACRGCRICRDNRLNDLVGRCIAEQSTSTQTFAVTLTYRGDVAESVVLYYEHVQLMLKRLRKNGFKVRYICAGEYGTEKGRAHWHIVLFFQGKVPDVEKDARIEWEYWPHGFSFFQNPDYRGFRYVMKYALKNEKSDTSVKALSMSKMPPLGYAFFMKFAEDIVKARLPIHSPEYAFSHVKDRNGRSRRYWLQGRMREMFLEKYCDLWQETYGGEPPYSDFLLEKHLDPIARREMANDVSTLERDIENKRRNFVYINDADYVAGPAETDVRPLGFLLFPYDENVIVSVSSDGVAEICIGDETCKVAEKDWSAGTLSGVKDLTRSQRQQVCQWLAEKMEIDRRRLAEPFRPLSR